MAWPHEERNQKQVEDQTNAGIEIREPNSDEADNGSNYGSSLSAADDVWFQIFVHETVFVSGVPPDGVEHYACRRKICPCPKKRVE